jgi:hypothetical protein
MKVNTEGLFLCPLCKKRSYSSKTAAEASVVKGIFSAKTPVRAYKCDCGSWHMTSWSPDRYVNTMMSVKGRSDLQNLINSLPNVEVRPTKKPDIQMVFVDGKQVGELCNWVPFGRAAEVLLNLKNGK